MGAERKRQRMGACLCACSGFAGQDVPSSVKTASQRLNSKREGLPWVESRRPIRGAAIGQQRTVPMVAENVLRDVHSSFPLSATSSLASVNR